MSTDDRILSSPGAFLNRAVARMLFSVGSSIARPLRIIAFCYRDQSQVAFHATGALSQYSVRSV